MKMQKRTFRIGQLAQKLGVERFVIRFWEKEFKVSTDRSTGGQRFYTQRDCELFSRIKHLLYTQGFTIAGAKQHLSEFRAAKHSKQPTQHNEEWLKEKVAMEQQISDLKKQLCRLRELL
jgi:DNA-binding transcriptional MerR regulator